MKAIRIGHVALAALLVLGCAHSPRTTDRGILRVAALPTESDAFPQTARALTSAMRVLKAPARVDLVVPKVTLEVVQLSIECVDPTAACWTAAGRSLAVQRLMLAQLGPGSAAWPVKVRLMMFDVERSRPLQVLEQQFENEDAAAQRVWDMVRDMIRSLEPPPVPGEGAAAGSAAGGSR